MNRPATDWTSLERKLAASPDDWPVYLCSAGHDWRRASGVIVVSDVVCVMRNMTHQPADSAAKHLCNLCFAPSVCLQRFGGPCAPGRTFPLKKGGGQMPNRSPQKQQTPRPAGQEPS